MKQRQQFTLPSIIIIILTITTISLGKKAFVAVPVTDLVANPVASDSSTSLFKKYGAFPLESIKGTFYCKRIHQLLFNEVVDIIEETNTEVKITIPNCFYIFYTNTQQNKQNTYWANKKDFVTFDQLAKHKLPTSCIPKPIHYKNSYNTRNYNYITLTLPFYDKKTKQTFSAGTRFVKNNSKVNSQKYTHVYIFNKKNYSFGTAAIPNKKIYNKRASYSKQSIIEKEEKPTFNITHQKKHSRTKS